MSGPGPGLPPGIVPEARACLVSALAFGGAPACVLLYGLVRQLTSGAPVRDLSNPAVWLSLGLVALFALGGALVGRRIAETPFASHAAGLGGTVVGALAFLATGALGYADWLGYRGMNLGGLVMGVAWYGFFSALMYSPIGMVIGVATWWWLRLRAASSNPA